MKIQKDKKRPTFYKLVFVLILLLSLGSKINAQERSYILIDKQTLKEYKKKDSLSAIKFLDSLVENNYFFAKIEQVTSENKQTKIYYNKGLNYNKVKVKLQDSLANSLKFKREFSTNNLDSLKKEINKYFINQGFTFNRISTKYLGFKNNLPEVELQLQKGNKRRITGFVIKDYTKVPKRFIKNLERDYLGKLYDYKNLDAIDRSLKNHQFVSLQQTPQTLFTKDSTTIYLFLQKKKSSTFDGIIGFGNNDEKKFAFNGSLNVNFKNLFNGFETVNIFWQRGADKGQTFNLQTDVPYLFSSNVGVNINLNIYRQDSTFANVKFLPAAYLNLNSKQKLGLRGTLESSVVTDSLYAAAKDFTKSGIGIWYQYENPSENPLFLYLTKIRTEADYLRVKYDVSGEKGNQNYFYLLAEHNLQLRRNHWMNFKFEGAHLDSKQELFTNELMRFGGWNTMRGFNENSIYANSYYYANAEYRYLLQEQAFFDFFLQYGQFNNKLLGLSPKIYSFGLGFNFFLPVGLMSFQISNGNEINSPIKFNDTKIHWGIVSRF